MKAVMFSFNLVSAIRQIAGTLVVLLASALTGHPASIVDSKHNLAVSGPGPVKALTETEICVFCHTPHKTTGAVPLWSHVLPTQNYTPYRSTTMKAADVGQPNGASKLCLSCHDGTVALGMVSSRPSPIAMRGGMTTLPAGRTRLGTDLSHEHPISFKYDVTLATANPELKDPTTLNRRVRLDQNRELQCTSCHDPHNDEYGKFLVQDNTGSALCLACHQPNGWNESIHKTSTATWNGRGTDPWPHTPEQNVAANACENCHAPHQAGSQQRLLNFSVAEQNCYSCHNGNVAMKNLQAEFTKFSAHPIVTTSALHNPTEDPINPARHVACADCHNAHAAQSSAPGSLHAPGSLVGVKGMSSAGTLINPVTREYELCYRCHADSIARGPAAVTRQFSQTNKRYQFAAGNASFHPVEVVGRNANVPSLIAPWTASSIMACTDCHNNNEGPGASGTGARGPHGSVFTPILERNLVLLDFQNETSGTYALCYKCHSRSSLFADESFPHRIHVVDNKTSCVTCHDSHGVQNATHLINFNSLYVTPFNGRLEFVDTGTFRGNCTLTCHEKSGNPTLHDAMPYGSGPLPPSALRKQTMPPIRRRK